MRSMVEGGRAAIVTHRPSVTGRRRAASVRPPKKGRWAGNPRRSGVEERAAEPPGRTVRKAPTRPPEAMSARRQERRWSCGGHAPSGRQLPVRHLVRSDVAKPKHISQRSPGFAPGAPPALPQLSASRPERASACAKAPGRPRVRPPVGPRKGSGSTGRHPVTAAQQASDRGPTSSPSSCRPAR